MDGKNGHRHVDWLFSRHVVGVGPDSEQDTAEESKSTVMVMVMCFYLMWVFVVAF